MNLTHHLHRFMIRHGRTIYYLVLDIATLAGLLWLCWIFTHWLAFNFPRLVN